MPAINILFLGTPSISREGQVVGASLHRHRIALLALLATAPGLTQRRDRLATILWPDRDGPTARQLLNVAIHGVRRTLDARLLVSSGEDVTLDTAIADVDVVAFDEAIRHGRFPDAVASWRGPFLDGFFLSGSPEFDHWLDAQRQSLDGGHQRALAGLAKAATDAGDHVGAVEWHRRLAATDPFNTRLVMELMLAMERAGDAPNAIQLAQRHEALLRAEVASEPDPSFTQLVTRLRTSPANALRLDAPRPAAAPALPTEPPRTAAVLLRRGVRSRLVLGGIAVAGTTAVVAGLRASGTPLDTQRIFVAPFTAAESTTTPVAATVARAAARALASWPDLSVVFPAGLSGTGERVAIGAARRAHAGILVRGVVWRSGDSLRSDISVVLTGRREIARAIHVSAPTATAFSDEVADRIVGAVAALSDPRLRATVGPDHGTPGRRALGHYLRGADHFVRAEYGPAESAFDSAARGDSTFSAATSMLALTLYHSARYVRLDSLLRAERARTNRPVADQHALEWMRARLRGDALAAHRAARAAAHLVPASPWVLAQAEEALALRRPREALGLLHPLATDSAWIGTWSGFTRLLGQSYHLLGDFDAELQLVRQWRRHGTNQFANMITESRPLAAMGKAAEIERIVNEALAIPDQPTLSPGSLMQRAADELEAHGFGSQAAPFRARARRYYESLARDSAAPPVVRTALARMLTLAGELDSALAILQPFLQRERAPYLAQAYAGIIAARKGDHLEAARYDSLLALPAPQLNAFDASVRVFWRACIAARAGDRDRAMELLQQAASMSVPMPLDSVHISPDLHLLRGRPAFDDLTRLRR